LHSVTLSPYKDNKMDKKYRIALLASGSGTNAENIIRYFGRKGTAEVVGVYCNKEGAGVFGRAEKLGVPCSLFSGNDFDKIEAELVASGVDLVILAGFLLKIPPHFIQTFKDKIINIHPALLPKYGGKGMYGQHVHEAVIAAGEQESGITIHLVDEIYDNGEVLFQAKCPVDNNDTPDILAIKIHELEYRYFPEVIEGYLLRPDQRL